MIRTDFIRRLLQTTSKKATFRLISTAKINIEKLESEQEQDSASVVEDDEVRQKEEELQRKRNKSRLKEADYRMLHEQNPYPEPTRWHHGTLKYMRRTYGRYGAASGVDPSICWPVKQELEDAKEYERVKYPYTIPQVIAEAKARREENLKIRLERQADIVKKVEKLEQWKRELHAKIEKKENEAVEAKLRKERLIEEVRRHFGYTVDPRDDKFKELLEKKEKEQKKAMKEERKKAREDKMMQKLLKKKDAVHEDTAIEPKAEGSEGDAQKS